MLEATRRENLSESKTRKGSFGKKKKEFKVKTRKGSLNHKKIKKMEKEKMRDQVENPKGRLDYKKDT